VQGSINYGSGRFCVDVPNRISQTAGKQPDLLLKMVVHILVHLILTKIRQDQATDKRRQEKPGAHGDQNTRAEAIESANVRKGKKSCQNVLK
jgi:hypothetical protein